jgi:hypothetical protein
MATVTKNQLGERQFGASLPVYGNLTELRYTLETNATGAVTDSDSASAVAIGDVVKIGIIPAGFTIIDLLATITTAWTASTTAKLGFAYVDGEDVTAVPQDDDFFIAAGQSLATAAIVRKTATTAPVTLPKDAWLILTTAGAANAKASLVNFIVIGEQGGLV